MKFWGPNWYEQAKYALWVNDKEFVELQNSNIPKPKLITVWEGNSLDILARESIEGLTKHQPKGKSRYEKQGNNLY